MKTPSNVGKYTAAIHALEASEPVMTVVAVIPSFVARLEAVLRRERRHCLSIDIDDCPRIHESSSGNSNQSSSKATAVGIPGSQSPKVMLADGVCREV